MLTLQTKHTHIFLLLSRHSKCNFGSLKFRVWHVEILVNLHCCSISLPLSRPQKKSAAKLRVVPETPPSPAPRMLHNIEDVLQKITVESTVVHKKFGKGTVMKIDKNEKFIHVKFTVGEKKFIFPDAFLMGFLVVE